MALDLLPLCRATILRNSLDVKIFGVK